jgi:hypothetical protein
MLSFAQVKHSPPDTRTQFGRWTLNIDTKVLDNGWLEVDLEMGDRYCLFDHINRKCVTAEDRGYFVEAIGALSNRKGFEWLKPAMASVPFSERVEK